MTAVALAGALGYAAEALSLPSKPPLTQAQIAKAEKGVRQALADERAALADVGKSRAQIAIFHISFAARRLGNVLGDELAGHDLGSYDPTPALNEALKLDDAADKETGSSDRKAHKRALVALSAAIGLKKKALALLENLSANGPTKETSTAPAPEPLEACAFISGPPTPTSGFPLVVKVFEPGQSGATGGINVTGVGASQARTFVVDGTGTARVQFGAQPGTAVITISLTTLSHQSQTFGPFTFSVSTATAPASDCAPHQ